MDEKMSPKIGSALFTDNNGPATVPFWRNIFDYYYIDPPAGKYTMATPSDRGRERIIPKGVKVNKADSSWFRDVRKVAGQGEFDNFHLAPKMIAPKEMIELDGNKNLTGLDNVTMAPFCVHDCVHFHTRWGDDADEKYTWGWVGQRPYAKAGAPLVPGNQEVTVEVHTPVSFTYKATAENTSPGQWQVMMHHGGAYALSYNLKANGALGLVGAVDDFWGESVQGHLLAIWTAFYWTLRYGTGDNGQFERLTWTPAQFAAVREIAAAKAATP
jgi:hypothetical protein